MRVVAQSDAPMQLAALLAFLTLVAPVAVQGGYVEEKHPELGIELPRARDYEQVPTQPDEEQVILYYVEKASKDPKLRVGKRSELSVVWIDVPADPPPPPADAPPPDAPPPPEEEGRSKAKPMGSDAPPPPPPIKTIQDFLTRRTIWTSGTSTTGKTRSGYPGRVMKLEPRGNLAAEQVGVGWAYVFEQPGKRTIAFVGECAEANFEEQSKIWRYIAEHAEFFEPRGEDLEKIGARYRSSALRGVDFRIKARSQLVRGWKAEDTENFILVFHTADQPLVRAIGADIEAIRKEYLKLFPPDRPIDAVSVVRICKDRGEYMAYGGPPGSAGYWNPQSEELVFYDARVKEKGKRSSGDADTFIVLYHEALHQYIHYSAGAVPPHYWFNEGHGDYFSGANISGGKVRSIGVNPWRAGYIKGLVERGQIIPWKDIIGFERQQFYDPARIGQCYAQAWSMVYFLRSSPVVRKHPQWSKIVDNYFQALKAEYGRRLEGLAKQGLAERADQKEAAGADARRFALDQAFKDIDLNALQAEWRAFVEGLELKEK